MLLPTAVANHIRRGIQCKQTNCIPLNETDHQKRLGSQIVSLQQVDSQKTACRTNSNKRNELFIDNKYENNCIHILK